MAKDYYSILGVAKGASEDEIKNAFRKLAHQHHPDKQGGDALKFKEINEAYQVLGNKDKRAKYDQFGSAAFDGSGGGGPGAGGFGGFGGFNPNDFQNINVDFGDLGDTLGNMFGFGGSRGGGGGRERSTRGSDIEVDLDLTFKEAAFGVAKEVGIYKGVRCDRCAGGGVEPGSKMNKCSTCDGKGRVQTAARPIFGVMQSVRDCSECDGRGEKPEKSCSSCRGTGVKKEQTRITLRIPAGVDEGGIMKIRGEGEAGPHGGSQGDLYIKLHVIADKQFDREGNTVFSDHAIGFTQAALGDTIKVETIHGFEDLKIPAGTQSHTEFKLKGKGIGGDHHIVTIIVEVPEKVSREQRKLIEDLNLRK
ncbi:MAG: molecular chaperone DnaJ [bacterium]